LLLDKGARSAGNARISLTAVKEIRGATAIAKAEHDSAPLKRAAGQVRAHAMEAADRRGSISPVYMGTFDVDL